MNAMSKVSPADAGVVPTSKDVTEKVFETHYGFAVRDDISDTTVSNFLKILSLGLAVGFLIPALGMWVSPNANLSADTMLFKIGASVALMACSVLFALFGLKPTPNEVQFDAVRREVREVRTDSAGRSHDVARFRFDDLSGTFLVREEFGEATLVMRYKNTQKFIYICKGDEYDLAVLKNRVGRQITANAGVVPISKATRAAPRRQRDFVYAMD